MKQTIYFILLLSLVTTSCRKTSVTEKNPDLPSIFALLNAMNKKTDATFGIGGNAPMKKGRAQFINLNFSGIFNGSDGLPKNIGEIRFGNQSWSSNTSNYYSGQNVDRSLLGKMVHFKFTKSGRMMRRDGGEEDSLYVPQEVIVTYPEYSNDISDNTAAPYNTFTWEPDYENTKGIVIMIEYRPEAIGNESFASNGHDELIRRAIVVEDNGEYALSESLFEDIPEGATIEISIIRANYIINESEDDGYSYTVYAYNYKSGIYRYQW